MFVCSGAILPHRETSSRGRSCLTKALIGVDERAFGSAHPSLDHRLSRLPSGRFTTLELSSAVSHVVAAARVQATAQDCAVCPLLEQRRHILFASRSRLLICVNFCIAT